MFDKYVFSDGQAFASISGTGAVSSNVWDIESHSSGVSIGQTRFMLRGYLNVVITALTYTSGLTQGLTLRLLHDSASSVLTTTRTSGGAGFYVLCSLGISLNEVVAGRTFSIPFQKERVLKYVGFWPMATSTALVGSVSFDAHFSSEPESSVLLNTQKQRNTSFG